MSGKSRWPDAGLAVLCILGAGLSVAAQTYTSTATDRTAVNVTIYNNGYGLVRERRAVQLPHGALTLRYEDVAAQIEPASVQLRSLDAPRALSVAEQDFEFDLLSPDKLLAKYVGRTVTLIGIRYINNTETTTETRATLLSDAPPGGGGTPGWGRIWRINGQIVMNPSYQSIRVPDLPGDLYARPTLLWELDNAGPAQQTLETTYLTRGMGWEADYVMDLSPDRRNADLTGWVTLQNRSGAAFHDASLQLVAGTVHVVPLPAAGPGQYGAVAGSLALSITAPPQFQEQPLFAYHLYTLQRRTNIQNDESKQIQLLSAPAVHPTLEYALLERAANLASTAYLTGVERPPVTVYLRFRNDAANGLDRPLPAGTVRVYQADASGGTQFIGEDQIQHTPKQENVKVKLGDAFDLVAERRRILYRVHGDKSYEAEYRVTLRNHKTQAVTVQDDETILGDWDMVSASAKWTQPDSNTARFEVTIPPGGEQEVTYRYVTRY